jgi:hypothetical protein
MTREEAIAKLTYSRELQVEFSDGTLVDALDLALAALGQQIPIAPIKAIDTMIGACAILYRCPLCDEIIGHDKQVGQYCQSCGQAIDGSDAA